MVVARTCLAGGGSVVDVCCVVVSGRSRGVDVGGGGETDWWTDVDGLHDVLVTGATVRRSTTTSRAVSKVGKVNRVQQSCNQSHHHRNLHDM